MNRGHGGGGQRNRPYDNTLLNDLHEIIPEAMYDSDLFNSPLLRFFQQRVGHMFPSYHRERGAYLREQADSRRHAFRSTRLSRMPNPVVQPAPATPPVAPTWPATIVQNYDPSTVSETFLRSLLQQYRLLQVLLLLQLLLLLRLMKMKKRLLFHLLVQIGKFTVLFGLSVLESQ